MRPRRILILGGTAEARILADALAESGADVTTSLAGVTLRPKLPKGKIRTGGFGGVKGLRYYLETNAITHLVDATHPFAAVMSQHAADAVAETDTALFRLERSPWHQQAGDQWIVVTSLEAAAAALPMRARVFLTTGRKGLAAFFARGDLGGVIRMIVEPDADIPPPWVLIRERPPHDVAHESELFQRHHITHLVTKNAGGAATSAKLEAARLQDCRVVMVARPSKPPCASFATVDDVVHTLLG